MSTRVTQSMLTRSVLSDIRDVSARLERTRVKLSSGKELTRPSDNPFAVGRALDYRKELGTNRQFQRNVSEANGWQTVTDTALRSIGDVLLRVRDLTVQGANGGTTANGRAVMAQEVLQLIDSIKSEANTKYAGRYVFGGSATLTAPYSLADDLYYGDANAIQREIGPGVQIPVNVVGSAVVGDAASGVLSVLRNVHQNLTTSNIAALGANLTALDAVHETVITARTDVGARVNRLDAASSRLSELEESTVSLLSQTEDADMAKTLVDASTQQAVYESALRAGANIVQSSLLDFLR